PIKDILHTNVVPSDSECQGIRHLLYSSQQQVDELTEELARLETMHKEISRKRRELQQFIDAHLALLSPMRRLPEDLVRAIFMACFPSARNPTLSGKDAPVLLCQICQSWRGTALAMPPLWAALHLVILKASQLQYLLERVAIWLKRSGMAPMDISVVVSATCRLDDGIFPRPPADVDGSISPLLPALVAISRRWRSVDIAVLEYLHAESPLLLLTSSDVPLLETVKIPPGINPRIVPDFTALAFLVTPSLRSLTLPGSETAPRIPVAWKSLTDLKITRSRYHYITSVTALTILRKCPSLQTCEFHIYDAPSDQTSLPPTEDVFLLRLTHLAIERQSTPQHETLLGCVTLPNLRSLHYTSRDALPAPNFRQLLPSTPSLESFSINLRALNSDTLLGASCKAVEPTHRGYLPADGLFLDRLTPATGLCPLLESIQLHNLSMTTDETVLRFVRSRTHPHIVTVRELTRVAVRFRSSMVLDILPPLEDAIARGLYVSLEYPVFASHPAPRYSPFEGTDSKCE
ncbi:hypothetical protein DFH06DRAFT_1387727, partial [Mycena polygramma]